MNAPFDPFLLFDPAEGVGFIWPLLKIVYLFGLGIYIAFAALVIRQISMMTRTIKTPAESFLKLLGYIHLALAIGIFVLALVIL